MREDAAEKAKRYVLEARLRITYLDGNRIRATCRGSGAVHQLGWDRGEWWCTCEARGACSHLRALWLVAVEPGRNEAA